MLDPTGYQIQMMWRCSLATAVKVRAPEKGISSFLGDIDYYSPLGPGMQLPGLQRQLIKRYPMNSRYKNQNTECV